MARTLQKKSEDKQERKKQGKLPRGGEKLRSRKNEARLKAMEAEALAEDGAVKKHSRSGPSLTRKIKKYRRLSRPFFQRSPFQHLAKRCLPYFALKKKMHYQRGALALVQSAVEYYAIKELGRGRLITASRKCKTVTPEDLRIASLLAHNYRLAPPATVQT